MKRSPEEGQVQAVTFKVLGPFEAYFGDRRARLPKSGQRILLATLVLNASQVVPVEEVFDHLWCDRQPDRPREALHSCVSRLRQWLDRQAPGAAGLLATSSGGYVMEIDPRHLDLPRFEDLTGTAAAARDRGDPAAQAAALGAALELWRGPAMSNVPSESLHRGRALRLTEQYLRTVEWWAEVELALGRYERLVGELRTLTVRYPFRERFWRQLMLALYGSGRRVEALDAYGRISARLRDEFGVDPTLELRDLQVAILRDDRGVLPASGLGAVGGGWATGPRVA